MRGTPRRGGGVRQLLQGALGRSAMPDPQNVAGVLEGGGRAKTPEQVGTNGDAAGTVRVAKSASPSRLRL